MYPMFSMAHTIVRHACWHWLKRTGYHKVAHSDHESFSIIEGFARRRRTYCIPLRPNVKVRNPYGNGIEALIKISFKPLPCGGIAIPSEISLLSINSCEKGRNDYG